MYRDMPARPAEGGHQHRQGHVGPQVLQLLPEGELAEVEGGEAGDGQPIQVDPEKHDEEQGQPESGHGEAEKDEEGGGLVKPGMGPVGGDHPDGNGHAQDDDQAHEVEAQGDADALLDFVPHRPPVRGEGAAEVQVGQPGEPVPVLHHQGLVQAVELPQALLGLQGGLGIHGGLHVGGGARGQVNDHERNQGDPQEHGDHQTQTFQDIEPHGFAGCRTSRSRSR